MDAGDGKAHAPRMTASGDTTSAPPPHAPPGTPPPRLIRTTDDKVVSGLCGGLGRHFGVDPVVFRIAFVVLALAGGSGVLLYLVGWLMVPDDRSGAALVDRVRGGRGSKVLAVVLAVAAACVLLGILGDDGDGGRLTGIVLVGVGAAVLWSRRDRPAPPLPPSEGGGPAPTPPAWAPPPPQPLSPPSAGPATPDSADTHTVADTGTVTDTGTGTDTGTVTDAGTIAQPESSATSNMTQPVAVAVAVKRPRSVLVPVTLSLLAILGGVLALLGATDTLDMPAVVVLALPLLLIGGALCIGARWGRARWLIPLGMVLSVVLMAAAIVDVPLRGGVGDRTFRPLSVSQLQSPYRLGAGDMVVDLGAVDLGTATRTVEATLGAGDLEVVVPAGADVVVDVHAGAGSVSVFGRTWDGFDVDHRVVERGREGGGRLIVNVGIGFGDLEVRRASS